MNTLNTEGYTYNVDSSDIERLIFLGNKSNANMAYNPETIHKYVADSVLKQHALNSLPHELRGAHLNGDLHIHDLEYFMSRGLNCLVSDIRYFIQRGLCVDGTGEHTSIAAPPKRLSTVMNHTGEILLSAQQDMSGGQGMTLWNVFVAPFAEGLTYDEVKDAVQQLIFNLNMAYASRGGQVPFTTIGLEFGIPKFLEDVPAYADGGKKVGVYGDYHDEAVMLQRAFTELLYEGDARGKPHLFPNTTYSLRPEFDKPEYEDDMLKVHELSAKYGSPYFVNMYPEYQGVHTDYMGCRTRLSTDWTGDWEQDCLRTGNLAYVTINLPRLGLEDNDEDRVIAQLDHQLELAKQILLIRQDRAKKCMDAGLFPFITQGGDDPYYRIQNSTMSFGFVGMDELCRLVTNQGLGHPEANKFAMRILKEVDATKMLYRHLDGNRWSVIQTPAESTAYRFATLDREKYGDKAVYKGTKESPYYTNSCHLPVDTDLEFSDKIKWESKTHPLTGGGHICHAFMGEAYSDPESLMSLTDKIKKTDIGFWAYSSALSYCMKCNTVMKGLQNKCTHCGETKEVEWYDRITGYVQQVGHAEHAHGGWNNGKKQELIDRRRW